jgi:hypothetical protein
MLFLMILEDQVVRRVLACTGPVAVKPFEQTRMADLISSRMIIEALQGYAPGMQIPDI